MINRKEKEMKYKEGYKEGVAVGDKFIIEIISIDKNSNYPYETVSGNRFNDDELSMMQQANGITEYYYNKGVEDAWKLMKRINEPRTMPENMEMFRALGVSEFCQVFELLTPQEAKTKFEAWKKAKEEIKVGDVVYATNSRTFDGIVIVTYDDWCTVVWSDGSCGRWFVKDLTKTGENHADKVADLIGLLK